MPILGRTTIVVCSLALWFASLYILFRFSVVHATLKSTQVLPKFSDFKESFKAEKELSKVRREKATIEKT